MIEILQMALVTAKSIIDKRWSSKAPALQVGMQYASAAMDDEVYVFGGRVGISLTARSPAYKYRQGVVTALADLPTTLAGACATAVGRKIYIIGGCYALSSGYENKKVYVYDVDTNTYTTETDMPVACVIGSCVTIGTDIYVYGGMNSQNEGSFPKLFYKYNTITKVWTSLTYHDGPALYSTSCAVFNGKLVAFGGEYNTATGNDVTVRVYDPVTDTWSKLTPGGTKPGPRGACVMVKYDDKRFVVIGGRVGNGTTCTTEVWVFDMEAVQWTLLSPMALPLAFHGGGLIENDNIVVFDGYIGSGVANVTYVMA